MPPESGRSSGYFDTPARAERLQLLQHLVRNAGEIIYLRAPAGAGKTLFAHRLLDALGDSYVGIWIRGGVDKDVASAAVAQLGLDDSFSLHWPKGILNSINDRQLLVVVDDADQVELPAIERLATMYAAGGRLLFLGHGGLASASGEWDAQFVDLPPLSVDESMAFLRERAGDAADRISDDLAGFLHHSAHGRPGPLLAALEDVLARKPESPASSRLAGPQRWAWWLAGAVGAALLGAVLLNQDRINAWFASDGVEPGTSAGREVNGATPATADNARAVVRPVVAPVIDEPPNDLVLSRPAEAVPPITLPELSRPTQAGTTSDDPLDAVMRDALAAATPETPGSDAEPETEESGSGSPADIVASRPVIEDGEVARGSRGMAGSADIGRAGAAEALVRAATPVIDAAPEAAMPGGDAEQPQQDATNRRPAAAVTAQPAAGRTEAATRQLEPPGTAVESITSRPTDAGQVASSSGVEWLRSRDPARYTLQLIGARDRAAIEKYVREHGVKVPYAIFARPLNGQPWYSLVAGDYPDRDAAVAARSRLPKSLSRADIWPRNFASVQENLR